MKKLKFLFLLFIGLIPISYAFAGGGDLQNQNIVQLNLETSGATIPIYSYDGKNFAFVSYENGKSNLFINGKSYGSYDSVDSANMFFDNNNNLFVKVKNGNKWSLTVGGKKEKEYDDIQGLTTPYGTGVTNFKYSYVGIKDSKYYLIYNGNELNTSYEGIDIYPNTDINFLNVIYIAKDTKGELLIINGKPGTKRYYDIGYNILGYNGKLFYTFAYSKEGKTIILQNGEKEVGKYDYVGATVFSSDDKKAYTSVMLNNKYYFLLNGVLIKQNFDNIKEFYYSYPNSKFFFQSVMKGGKEYIIVNGKPENKYDEVSYISISPDGKNYFYFARNGEKWVGVLNGVETK